MEVSPAIPTLETPAADLPAGGAIAEDAELIPRVDRAGSWLQIRSAAGFEWNQYDIPVVDLPAPLEGLRILHLTDFHCRRYWDPAYDDLLARIAARPPDIIFYTGDFVDNRFDFRRALPIVQKWVQQLKSRLGTFAILGNHDGDLMAPALAGLDITLIDHRRLILHSGDAAIELIGVAGVDRLDLDLFFLKSLGDKPTGAVRIILSHFPDTLRKVTFLRPDLYLCGHTHGGQICLPTGLPIIRHDNLPRRFGRGIHRLFGTWLVVNRGLGFSSRAQVRLFCPAEVIEMKLVRR